MSFEAGDVAVVVRVANAVYPPPFQPGTIVIVLGRCGCAEARGFVYWRIRTESAGGCAAHETLRKIDPEPRAVVTWDWRELLVKAPAQEDQVPAEVG